MTVDIEELQKKKKEMQERADRAKEGDILWLRPEFGTTEMRILPPFRDDVSFYVEVAVHYLPDPDNPGKSRPYLCLRQDKDEPIENCSICEIEKALYETKDKDDAIEANQIRRQDKFLMNILDRTDALIKIYMSPPTVYTKILGIFCDPHWKDISHPKTGKDVTLEKRKKKNWSETFTGRRNVEYDVRGIPEERPLKDEEWVGKLYELDNILKERTAEELTAVYEGQAGFTADEEQKAQEEYQKRQAEEEKEAGIAIDEKEEKEEEEPPRCFGEYDDKDKHCAKCSWTEKCNEKTNPSTKEEAETTQKPKSEAVKGVLDRIKKKREGK